MKPIVFIVSSAVAMSIIVVMIVFMPKRFVRIVRSEASDSLKNKLIRIKHIRRLLIPGEIMMIVAYVFLCERVSSSVLFPFIVISVSIIVGMRVMYGLYSKQVKAVLEDRDKGI